MERTKSITMTQTLDMALVERYGEICSAHPQTHMVVPTPNTVSFALAGNVAAACRGDLTLIMKVKGPFIVEQWVRTTDQLKAIFTEYHH